MFYVIDSHLDDMLHGDCQKTRFDGFDALRARLAEGVVLNETQMARLIDPALHSDSQLRHFSRVLLANAIQNGSPLSKDQETALLKLLDTCTSGATPGYFTVGQIACAIVARQPLMRVIATLEHAHVMMRHAACLALTRRADEIAATPMAQFLLRRLATTHDASVRAGVAMLIRALPEDLRAKFAPPKRSLAAPARAVPQSLRA